MDNTYPPDNDWEQNLLPDLNFQPFEYDDFYYDGLFDAAFGVSSPPPWYKNTSGTDLFQADNNEATDSEMAEPTAESSPHQSEVSSPSQGISRPGSSTHVRIAPNRSSLSRHGTSDSITSAPGSDQIRPIPRESTTSSPRVPRRGPSPDAIERRRKQNRVSQLAFRERSKKALEEMRVELLSAEERNRQMYSTLNELLGAAESMKLSIEQALQMHGKRDVQ